MRRWRRRRPGVGRRRGPADATEDAGPSAAAGTGPPRRSRDPPRWATSGWPWSPRSTSTCPTSTPTVVLRETESPRRQLSFSIGLQDGVALSHAMRRIPTPRPLTHELMSQASSRGSTSTWWPCGWWGARGRSTSPSSTSGAAPAAPSSRAGPPTASPWRCSSRCRVPILIDRRLFEERGRRHPTGPRPGRPTGDRPARPA